MNENSFKLIQCMDIVAKNMYILEKDKDQYPDKYTTHDSILYNTNSVLHELINYILLKNL